MVAYMDSKTIEDASTMLLPTGVDIIVTGAKSEDEVVFTKPLLIKRQISAIIGVGTVIYCCVGGTAPA